MSPKKTKNPNPSPIGNRFGFFLFGGRGWITQAAHLKRPRRGLFAAGTQSAGPYELRLPIFLQPLGGALKNRSAAPASPPCFRRRRRSAPLLFESTLATLYKLPDKTETPVSLQHWSSWWARVDYASRAAKNSLAGCFCPAGRKAPGRNCSHPPAYVSLTFAQKKTASVSLHQRFFHGRGWIRTTEAEKQQIYSLSPLATREHAHIQFFAVADCLYILPLGGVFVNCFLQLFQKRS